ncbi:MAG: type II secretion system protein [Planctomycetes bacterium]|nr:type II secretion system protein [Planctomycetota bacterium]
MSKIRRRPGGFTLIELVMVLVILAAIAGLVIPQVAMLGRSADMAATAKNAQDVANNIQLHFVQLKRYPQYMDSLVTTESTPDIYDPAKDYSGTDAPANESEQLTGLPISGPSLYADLAAGTVSNVSGGAQWYRSFSRGGFDFVMDHSYAVTNSNNSATTSRALASGMTVAEVQSGSVVAKAIYPATAGVPPASERLVALGFGPSNSAIGKTTLQAPIYPGCDGKYYGRYIAIFKIYANGERPTLCMVTDSYGRYPDYSIQQFNESLPDGGRQG